MELRKTFLNFPPSAPNHCSNFVGPLIVIDDLFTLELFCHLSGEVCGLRGFWHGWFVTSYCAIVRFVCLPLLVDSSLRPKTLTGVGLGLQGVAINMRAIAFNTITLQVESGRFECE